MPIVLSDRVQETTTTAGTLDIVLNGAVGGFQSFKGGIGNGNKTYYSVENFGRWEVGIGTYTESGNTLTRDTVLASNNSNNKIILEGVSSVFVTYPASKYFALDENGYATSPSYAGIKFPDGSIQASAAFEKYDNRVTGVGSANTIPYWDSTSSFTYDSSLKWNSENTKLINNKLTQLAPAAGLPLELVRQSAGNVFHGYVDNDGKVIGLHLTNESSPTWKLGLKNNDLGESVAPNQEYVYGGNSSAGMYASSDTAFIINYVNGFWIKHKGGNLLNAGRTAGFVISNQVASSVAVKVKSALGQAANLHEWQKNDGSTLLSVDKQGALTFNVQISDTNAPNNSLYYSSTQNKLSFKDDSGVVNALY